MKQNSLSSDALEARREYFRKWRAANKDKVANNNRRYWEKRAQKIVEGGKENERTN